MRVASSITARKSRDQSRSILPRVANLTTDPRRSQWPSRGNETMFTVCHRTVVAILTALMHC